MLTTPTVTPRGFDRSFNIGMALIAIVMVVVAFAPSLVNSSTRLAPLTPLALAHGIVFGSWFLFFLAQATLVATGRTAVHRRIGKIGAGLAVVMIGLGTLTSIRMAQRGFDLSGDLGGATANIPLLLALQLGDLAVFGVLVAAALGYRRRPGIHKRLMLLATVSPFTLMGAPFAHLRGHWPQLAVAGALMFWLLLFSSAIHDRVSGGRFHPVSLWGAIVLLVWGVVRGAVIVPSSGWQNFAAWLVR